MNLPRISKHEHRYLTHDQVDDLARACGYPPDASKHSSYHTRTNEMYRLVMFLAYTGVRLPRRRPSPPTPRNAKRPRPAFPRIRTSWEPGTPDRIRTGATALRGLPEGFQGSGSVSVNAPEPLTDLGKRG